MGMGNQEIGSELGISKHTVATHFVNIFRKLGVESRTEATLYALKEGWFTVEDLSQNRTGN
jgi:DNA-binding NarL/FixJ family response regulator